MKTKARENDIVIQKLKDETLIYDLDTNRAFCLNETSALVWQLCDGNRSASEIGDEMSKRMKTLVSEELVWLTLDQLNKSGLLTINNGIDDHFAGLSRREVIRKVGLASIVTLPIVSSLVAPQAAEAQSCGILHSVCVAGTDCCTGNCASGVAPFPTCCAVGTSFNAIPGAFNCTKTDALDCSNTFGAVFCCSGTSTYSGQGACNLGQTQCVCD